MKKHLNSLANIQQKILDEVDSLDESIAGTLRLRVGSARVFVRVTGHVLFRFTNLRVDGQKVTNSTLKPGGSDQYLEVPASFDRVNRVFHPLVEPQSAIMQRANEEIQKTAQWMTESDYKAMNEHFNAPKRKVLLLELSHMIEPIFHKTWE